MNFFFFVWLVILVLKFGVSAFIPLYPDEAYYWVWGQNLQLSYWDHPPFVAWLFKIGSYLDFSPGSSRWPAIALGHTSILIWYQILKNQLGNERLGHLHLLFLCSPLLGVGSLIVTPDLPLVFFWSAAIYFYLRALESGKWIKYLIFGLILGLGFSSKYHMVLLPLSLLVSLIWEKKWQQVRFAYIPLTFFAFILTSLPVWVWNLNNHWQSFRFQLHHGLGGGSWSPIWTLGYVISQVLVLGPSLLALLKGKTLRAPFFTTMICLSIVPLVFFFFTSFKGTVEANWPIIALPSFYAIVLLSKSFYKNSFLRRAHYFVYSTLGVLSLLIALLGPFSWSPDKLFENRKFSVLKEPIEALEVTAPVYASSYQMASILSHDRRAFFPKLSGMSRYDFFDRIGKGEPNEKEFFLATELNDQMPRWLLDKERFFITEIEQMRIYSGYQNKGNSPQFVFYKVTNLRL
jgi:4-amino-4-deoxy-L-arabinose transferase-like glycosyltransferase